MKQYNQETCISSSLSLHLQYQHLPRFARVKCGLLETTFTFTLHAITSIIYTYDRGYHSGPVPGRVFTNLITTVRYKYRFGALRCLGTNTGRHNYDLSESVANSDARNEDLRGRRRHDRKSAERSIKSHDNINISRRYKGRDVPGQRFTEQTK